MKSALAPYRQIGIAIGRSFFYKRAFWPYFAFACCAVFVVFAVVADGPVMNKSAASMLKVGAGLFEASLFIYWVFFASQLMALNHPNVARLVPDYARYLRRTALLCWLLVSALAGALNVDSWQWWLFHAFAAGMLMLLFAAPMRWPLQWFLVVGTFAWLSRHLPEVLGWTLWSLLPNSRDFQPLLLVALFAALGCLVARLIPDSGTTYAWIFSRFTGMRPGDFSAVAHKLDPNIFGAAIARWTRWANALNFPLKHYVERMLRAPSQKPGHVLARVELVLGAVHWVTQAGLMLTLVGVASLLLITGSWLRATALPELLVQYSVLIAGLLLMIAVLPVIALRAVMLVSGVEQSLLLLVPGMPHGALLNRLLAVRHLRQALVGWLVAALVAVNLPYRGYDAAFTGSLYVIGFLSVPMVVVDWARIREPSGDRAIGWLLASAMPPILSFLAMHRFGVSGLTVGLVALATCVILTTYRWRRLAHFPQALPAGRLAYSRP